MGNSTRSIGQRAFRRWFALALGASLIHLNWMVWDFGGTEATRRVADISLAMVALIAGVACLTVARAGQPGRRHWTNFAAAALTWAAAQATFAWERFDSSAVVPQGSLSDVLYLACVPLACWGAMRMASTPSGAYARARLLLDGLSIGAVLFFLGWVFAVGPIFGGFEGTRAEAVLTAAYPLGDVLLATIGLTVVIAQRSTHGMPRVTLTLLGLGLVGFVGSDIASQVAGSSPTYVNGGLIDTGFFVSFLLLTLAAAVPAAEPDEVETRRRDLWGQVVPNLGAGVVLAVVLAHGTNSQSLDAVSIWLASCLIVFVLIRQIVSIVEERRLAFVLQERVDDRTAQLSRREDQFRALVQQSSDVIVIVRQDGTFDYVSPSVQHVLGHTAEQLEKGSVDDLVIDDDRSRMKAVLAMAARRPGSTMTAEWRLRRADSAVRQVEVLVRNLVGEPAVEGIVLNVRDVTDRKELENRLSHQALHDDLTGLANRSFLRLRIDQAIGRWLFRNEPFSLVVVDVDDFKAINDSLGHVAGDAVLKIVAERIERCTRRGDTLVRLGGDEFAVLLEGVAASDDEARLVAERIILALQEPMRIEGRTLALRGSVGLACVTEQVAQPDDILRNADLALHAAKSSERGGFVRFELAMHDSALRRVELEADLRRAIENDEFQLYYQPTVDLATGKMDGVEALLRWPHPDKGFVSPADFIPIAEESGLIVPLGTWVLRHACNEMTKWQMRYPQDTPLVLNVNLSGRQLAQPDIVETVRNIILESGIAPGSLVLEMTESVLLDNNPTTLAKMQALVDLGVELAIDDFGTGYSSLSYLRQFPISVLKIDRSFVNGVGRDGSEDESALVQAIIDLARTLRLRTVGEGIETRPQLDELRRMGCDVGQGFFMARPAAAEEVRRLIEQTVAADKPVPAAAVN